MNVVASTASRRECIIAVDLFRNNNSKYVITAQPRRNTDPDNGHRMWDSYSRRDDALEYRRLMKLAPRPESAIEAEILLDLKSKEWLPAGLYHPDGLQRVTVVHDSLLCVVYDTPRDAETRPGCPCNMAFFVSPKTMRVLCAMEGHFGMNIVMQTASIYVLEGFPPTLKCMEPRCVDFFFHEQT